MSHIRTKEELLKLDIYLKKLNEEETKTELVNKRAILTYDEQVLYLLCKYTYYFGYYQILKREMGFLRTDQVSVPWFIKSIF